MGFFATEPITHPRRSLRGRKDVPRRTLVPAFPVDGSEPGPFGEKRHSNATLTTNPWQFSTKYWDEETGLGYWGYRWYEPERGRWASRDPVGEKGGMNAYSFLLNRSTDRVDSKGLDELTITPLGRTTPSLWVE